MPTVNSQAEKNADGETDFRSSKDQSVCLIRPDMPSDLCTHFHRHRFHATHKSMAYLCQQIQELQKSCRGSSQLANIL